MRLIIQEVGPVQREADLVQKEDDLVQQKMGQVPYIRSWGPGTVEDGLDIYRAGTTADGLGAQRMDQIQ